MPTPHILEIIGVTTGLINVILIARNNTWNWLFGIIAVTCYIFVFLHAKLYADMSLQIIYLLLSFYGLYEWRFGAAQHSPLPITRATRRILLSAIAASILLFVWISFVLQHYTDSTTVFLDAVTTALSLVAQYMMCRKWLEHWFIWFLVNSISVIMYFEKNLYLTASLYAIFLFFCFYGFAVWKRELHTVSNRHFDSDFVSETI